MSLLFSLSCIRHIGDYKKPETNGKYVVSLGLGFYTTRSECTMFLLPFKEYHFKTQGTCRAISLKCGMTTAGL
jgi:hypothetical protein